MAIDQNISDLFFNTDLELAKTRDARGDFTGWSEAALRREAESFLGYLDRIGVARPTVDELLADFHARL